MGSGYRNFAVGEVLTSSNVMNYLMEQSVMSFADSTARDAAITSPEEGMVAYLRDIDVYTGYTGSAWREILYLGWRTYTPSWTAATTNPTIGNGTISGRYWRSGNTVGFIAQVTAGSTTTFGSGQMRLSWPVTARTSSPDQSCNVFLFDNSSGQGYMGLCTMGATEGGLNVQGTADLDNITATSPFTFATSDVIRAWGTFEAA